MACHEESQRLQRMCRDLKNKLSLTKCLHEGYLKTVVEAESLNSRKKLIADEYDIVDATITGNIYI